MKIITPIPVDCYLAISGGVDSMVVDKFLRMGNRKVTWLYFNHDTKFGHLAEDFLTFQANSTNTTLHIGRMSTPVPDGASRECHWREERYKFLDQFTDKPVVLCHHLDDQVEQLVFSFINGKIRPIPYRRGSYIRPFLKARKEQIFNFAMRHNVRFLNDPSNLDLSYNRNRIRHKIIPELLKVNPGLRKTLLKYCDEQ